MIAKTYLVQKYLEYLGIKLNRENMIRKITPTCIPLTGDIKYCRYYIYILYLLYHLHIIYRYEISICINKG